MASNKHAGACQAQGMLGHFNPSKDILIANFDSKTDPDDLHSIAALGTLLADKRLHCVNYIAVAGAYGIQSGDYIKDPALFNLAFGDNWADADGTARPQAVITVADRAMAVLDKGGDIWIQEAGQSDVSAAVIRRIQAQRPKTDTQKRIHIVQHSNWNEDQTSPEDLAFVRANTNYNKIADGNATGNGTPGFNTADGADWAALLARPVTGAIWAQAKKDALSANAANIATGKGYNNHNIQAGGFDFSDAAEATWIFGFNDLKNSHAFFETFK
ncbi:MAG: hypothetical protein WBQ60_05500 [Asticcacaulis sp.]